MKYRCAPESTWISCEMKTNYSSWTAADTRDFILHLSLQEKSSELYVNRLPSMHIPTKQLKMSFLCDLDSFPGPETQTSTSDILLPGQMSPEESATVIYNFGYQTIVSTFQKYWVGSNFLWKIMHVFFFSFLVCM